MIAASTPVHYQNLHGWWAIGMTTAVWTVAGIGRGGQAVLPGPGQAVLGRPVPALAGWCWWHQADDRRHGLGALLLLAIAA